MDNSQAGNYRPLNLDNKKTVLERIRKFEQELSGELDQPVSVVAYTPQTEVEDLGHS
ncbi:hypothetical protein [Paenibacillus hamazuiensis]|uniref:hypothetical protein n=1 Tax=Paenibacillus hamazuiensis TaxID=2936508 RepID=UPI00200E636A|nr:hypothetical protein [Paenibacillus hamazuiensis]